MACNKKNCSSLESQCVFTVLTLYTRKNNSTKNEHACIYLQVPCMPLLPAASVFCNHLMLMSVIDMGSFIASLVLAVIGMVGFAAIGMVGFCCYRYGGVLL